MPSSTPSSAPSSLWPSCAAHTLRRHADGWLEPTAAYFQAWLARPELALVDESCRSERQLHGALQDDPMRVVPPSSLQALKDDDARENYQHFLTLRDGLMQIGTLQGWLLDIYRKGNSGTPPLFIDLVLQAVLQQLLTQAQADAFVWRAAEVLFREQRITRHEGRVLSGDRTTLDLQRETAGFGDLGRLLAQAQQPLKAVQLQVLSTDNTDAYFEQALRETGSPGSRHPFLLDLTHDLQQTVGHGLVFHLTQSRSGLTALCNVMQLWVQHLLGVSVRITPQRQVDDKQWRWHLGLDAHSSALLNDLYEERSVAPERLSRLISLFRLDFEHAGDMQASVAGRPVYLGLMASEQQLLRMKPQNLLLNLPLARSN